MFVVIPQLPTARRVANVLKRFRGRVVGGRKLQIRIRDGNRLWFVQTVGQSEVTSKSTVQPDLDPEVTQVDPGDDFWDR